MDYAALQAELAARGTDYLATRGATYINLARAQLDASYLWPYRKTSATGTAGAGTVTATDLGVPYVVQDTANNFTILTPYSHTDLLEGFGDLTTAGSPFAYYSSVPGTLTGYPFGGTIKAFYYKVTADLSGPTDTPACPSAYHGLIVDMAVQMAYRDSDDHDAAERLQVWIDRQMNRMVDDLFAGDPTDAMRLSFNSVDW